MSIFEFHNLIFILPLILAALIILAMAIGLPLGDHDVHVGVGGGTGMSGIGDAIDGVHGADVGHTDAAPGLLGAFSSFLGLGKVPFAVTLVTFGLLFGGSGLILVQVWGGRDHIWTCVFLASVVSVVGTGALSNLLAKIIPSYESYGVDPKQLISQEAQVIHKIDESGGTVRLIDEHGTMRDLSARTDKGQKPIKRGSHVELTGYDAGAGYFSVGESGRGHKDVNGGHESHNHSTSHDGYGGGDSGGSDGGGGGGGGDGGGGGGGGD